MSYMLSSGWVFTEMMLLEAYLDPWLTSKVELFAFPKKLHLRCFTGFLILYYYIYIYTHIYHIQVSVYIYIYIYIYILTFHYLQ